MAIIATKGGNAKAVVEYPKLMIEKSGLVVLMIADSAGMVVLANNHCPVGHCSEDWHIPSFTDFNGTVALKNEA